MQLHKNLNKGGYPIRDSVGRMPRKNLRLKSKTVKKRYRTIHAYIMTNMYPGAYDRALDEMKRIRDVEKISFVTGDYDIVVEVNVKNLENLHELTNQLHHIKGVEKTNTQVIEKEYNLL